MSYRAIYYTKSDGTQQAVVQAETWEAAVAQIEAQDDFDAWHTQPAQIATDHAGTIPPPTHADVENAWQDQLTACDRLDALIMRSHLGHIVPAKLIETAKAAIRETTDHAERIQALYEIAHHIPNPNNPYNPAYTHT